MDILDIGHSVKQPRQKFAHITGLPLRQSLLVSTIETALRAEGVSYRCCLLDPVVGLPFADPRHVSHLPQSAQSNLGLSVG